jgi:tRNA pseudouridine38-40 synthase
VTNAKTYRYKLTIEYDGSPYVGWQMQNNGDAVQSVLQEAVKGFSGKDIIPYGAGRTDAGVHATGQVAHIDLPREFPTQTVRDAINQHLRPAPIAILHVEAVSKEFDARFSACMRHYRYHIVNRRPPLALLAKRAWLVHVDLDADAMHKAGQLILGKHDFTAFRSVNCQAKTPLKTLSTLEVERCGGDLFVTTSARSFMHNQVRSIVGSLKMVGEGKWPMERMREVLESKDRAACGPVAPAHGLYFSKVEYPE